MITISSDLGEIKGALGLKADKDETGQLRTSVMRRIDAAKEETRKEAEKEFKLLQTQHFKFSHKILYLIITLLSSGFMLMLGNWLANK